MLLATGNINQPYDVIDVITLSVSRPEGTGCSAKGLPIDAVYKDALEKLKVAGQQLGADGVIHIGFDYRVSTTSVGCSGALSNFELYAWGTAIKIKS